MVGDGEILFAIVVEIANRDRVRGGAGGEVSWETEVASAITEVNRYVVVSIVGGSKILFAVPIEIAGRDRERKNVGEIGKG